jgi:photosystem II stability/assembly factor-like uncharacterized protein
MLSYSKNYKTFFVIALTALLVSFGGSFNFASAQQNVSIDPDAYYVLNNAQNNIQLPVPLTFPKSDFVFSGDNILADTMTLNANPGPANNGGSATWGMFFDLIGVGSNNVIVTQMSTANTGAANASFSVTVYTYDGTALGGPVGSGHGSSSAGWTSLGTVPCVQGPTASGISLIFNLPPILVTPGDTTGVALVFTTVGPRYYGTGSPPYEIYADTNLKLVTGDGRSAPFTPTGSFFSSRALCGVVRYVVETAPPNGWVSQTSGVTTSLNTVSAVSQSVGWIGGNGGVVLRTTDGGTTWTNVTGSPIGTADVYCICGIDANTCLLSTSPAATFVYRTTNGGSTWTEVFTQAGGFMDDIKFINANTGFMYGDPVGARWSLWKTTDAGATWDSTGLFVPQAGSEAGWNNAMWRSGNNLWFGTNNTRVYYSTNLGASWNFGATTGSTNSYSVAFNTGGIGFTGQTVALKSTDGGANYSSVTLPGTGTCYSFNNVLDRFWYDRGSIIYWSSDNGANFASQYTGTGTFQAMDLTLDGNVIRGWSVTSTGGIAGYYELISGISNNNNQVPSNYVLSQNYPNPFNPSTKISYSLPKAGNVNLVVYDILGREVAVLVNEFTTAGNHTIDFNASGLSSGVYLYKIQSGNFTATKKMVLVK